jgi:F420H(2)-dependent quinone reductase
MTTSTPSKRGTDAARGPWLPPRWVIRTAWAIHRGIYALSGGRRGLTAATPVKQGMLRLTTVGRRSGQRRAAILGYFEDGPNLVTMAMNGWGAPEPAWWLNLQARPDATVEVPGRTLAVRGRAATPEERPRLWERWRQLDGADLDGWAARRPRETAVVIFEPRPYAGTDDGSLGRSPE